MGSKHTPGPWRQSYDRGYFVEPVAPDQIGRVCTIEAPRRSEAGLANARLIAAAPEMLGALVALRGLLCDPSGEVAVMGSSGDKREIRNALSVIPKATGET